MGDNHQDRIPRLINTAKAAEMLGRSPATLKRWRYQGVGPTYVTIERRVRYDVAALIDYVNGNTRTPSVWAALEDTRETF